MFCHTSFKYLLPVNRNVTQGGVVLNKEVSNLSVRLHVFHQFVDNLQNLEVQNKWTILMIRSATLMNIPVNSTISVDITTLENDGTEW